MADGAGGTLVRGGHWLDLDGGHEAPLDLRFRDGRLVEADQGLAADGEHVVDATGDLLVPGFTDLHAHVFRGIGECIDADAICLPRGTTNVVDGGSAGAGTIDAFAEQASSYATRVRSWLNLSTIGIIDSRYGELTAGVHVDPELTAAAARTHGGFVVGFKARISTYAAGGGSRRVLEPLREVADAAELPIMVHIGDTLESVAEILPAFQAGDVVTHSLTGRRNGIVDAEGVLPAVAEAQERGVIFDAAAGRSHWSFDVMEAAYADGFLPDTLSSDVTRHTAPDPHFGQTLMGTWLLSLGIAVEDVLARMTLRPARVLGFDVAPAPRPGEEVDVAIVRVENGDFEIRDVDGDRRRVDRRISAVGSVRAGSYYAAPTVEGTP